MNESAIDSFQNAITDSVVSISGSFGIKFPTIAARLLVILFNVPLMKHVDVMHIPPACVGSDPALNRIVSQYSVILACLFAFFSVMVYGKMTTGSVSEGLIMYWTTTYDMNAFLVASISSAVWLAVFSSIETVVRRIYNWPIPHPSAPSKVSVLI
ncbi:hypothetical protein BASA83_001609 [Batrachochytrium salamandrivorans]|nr:hypothetical protein BASA83_001609 [Batrachochytrium salamandrivorans]